MDVIKHAPDKFASKDVNWSEAFTIVPVGDLQLMSGNIPSGESVNVAGFRRHLEYVEKTYPNPLYLGMGDYTDFLSPSNRESVKKSKIYEQSREYMDEAALALADVFLDLVRGTEGRWLGILSGHHYYDMMDGTTTDQYIARELGAPFLGTCGHVTVQFNDGKKKAGAVNIWCHHGEGTRKYPAGKLVDNVAPHWPEVDLFFMGHMHESDAARIPRYTVDSNGDLVTRNALAVVTGAWLEPVTAGVTSYVEKRMLRPRATGAPVVVVEPYRDEKGRRRRRFRYIAEL